MTSWLPFVGGWHCSFHLRLLSASGATQALSLPPYPSKPSSAAACEVFVSSSMSSISLTTSNAGITTNSIKPDEKVNQKSIDLSKISKSLSKMNKIVDRLGIWEKNDTALKCKLSNIEADNLWLVDNLLYFQFLRWKVKYIVKTDNSRFEKKVSLQWKKVMSLLFICLYLTVHVREKVKNKREKILFLIMTSN